MSYFSNISSAITTLVEGMKVTMGYFVRPREHVTLQYPDEVWPIPTRNIGVGELDSYNTIRSKLVVDFEDCIGCKACERACPVDCIDIETFKAGPDEDIGTTKNGTKIKLRVTSFTIDMSECMFCDLCVPPCPEDCIRMTSDYQFISNDNVKLAVTPEERWRDRNHLIYEFSKVSPEERKQRTEAAEKVAAEKAAAKEAKRIAAEKAAAAKAAAEQVSLEQTETEQVAPESQAVTPETPESSNPATPESGTAADRNEGEVQMEKLNIPLENISRTDHTKQSSDSDEDSAESKPSPETGDASKGETENG